MKLWQGCELSSGIPDMRLDTNATPLMRQLTYRVARVAHGDLIGQCSHRPFGSALPDGEGQDENRSCHDSWDGTYRGPCR